MSDALNKNIPVNQPAYGPDGDPETVMYNWQHVRAVGPNCLKDTRLIGSTIMGGVGSAVNCFSDLNMNFKDLINVGPTTVLPIQSPPYASWIVNAFVTQPTLTASFQNILSNGIGTAGSGLTILPTGVLVGKAGKYLVTATLNYTPPATDNHYMGIGVDGLVGAFSDQSLAIINLNYQLSITVVVSATIGQLISIQMRNQTAVVLPTFIGVPQMTALWVGP